MTPSIPSQRSRVDAQPGGPWIWRALTWTLRQLPAEFAHQVTLRLLALAGRWPVARRWLARSLPAPPPMPLCLGDLTFINRVGLAAGYDKNAIALQGLALLGFGHIEVGTVTPRPQPGNPRPRVFRRLAVGALINRMGFPSDGAQWVADRLARYRRDHALGTPPLIAVNLGKNKETPLDQAAADYALGAKLLAPFADVLVLNVSSPNTPELRALQTVDHLQALLAATRAAAQSAADRHVPVWVKLAPDLEPDDLTQLVRHLPADGLVLTNTTVSRPAELNGQGDETGGLSGLPLAPLALQVQDQVLRSGCTLPIVASGGVVSAERAVERLKEGADLVQLWTGLVLHGPALVGQVGRALVAAQEGERG